MFVKLKWEKLCFPFLKQKKWEYFEKGWSKVENSGPEMNPSWKNKSVIFFVFRNILSESKNRAKTRSKLGFGPKIGQGCSRG